MGNIKTGFTAQETIFQRMLQSGVKSTSAITGGIFKNRRPKDSQKEDIVVRTLAMNSEQVQEGLINVNIHLPNLLLSNDSTQPNEARFNQITELVLAALRDYRGFDYWFTIKVPGLLYPDGNNWFSNIQVEFTSLIKEN
jgi:hypothetical protein